MIAAGVGAILVLLAVLVTGNGSESGRVWAVILMVLAGLALWSDQRISRAVTALVLLGIVEALGLAGDRSAFEGFAQPAFFFFLALLFVTTSIEEAGTARRVAMLMIRRRGRVGSLTLMWRLPLAMVASAVVISSATGRTGLVIPVAERLLQFRGTDHGLRTYLTVFLSHLSPLTSRVFLSGGAGVIVAADILRRAGYSFNWLSWFVWIGVPTLAVVGITSVAHWLWLRPQGWDGSDLEVEPLDRRDWLLIASVLAMVATWIAGPKWGLTPTTGAIVGMGFTAAALGTTLRPVQLLNWDLVIFVGGTISLAHVIVVSGTANWVGTSLAEIARPFQASPLLPPVLFAVFVLLRLPLHNGVSYSAIVLPIALGMGRIGAVDSLVIAFIAIISASITFLPVQATPAMLSHSRRPAATRESVISGLLNFAAALCVILFIVGPYWHWLRRGG